MFKEVSLDKLLKEKKISQKTYNKTIIAKQYIEQKYNLKTIKNTEFNNFIEKIKSADISDEEKLKMIKELNHNEAEKSRKAREKQTIRDYESLSIIGRGAFGEVHVCREIKTGQIVAIKKIKKDLLQKKNQVIHIRNEQLFMAKVKSPWIVDLKASFQEGNYLYLVMEYLPGGDFMNLLIKKDTLPEEEAKFYIAELILAVESIHKMDCIHRDIKPDNILIGKDGHIKLSDFGLAKVSDKLITNNFMDNPSPANKKKMTHKKIFSVVGTAYYVAPEVLIKKGYGKDIDWWSVGVIFFEMLVGYAPFCSEETSEVCYKILNFNKYLEIPPEIKLSTEAQDLIKQMINNTEKRLGKNGADEIKAHPFFKGINWENLRKEKAPFVPKLKNDYDSSYFETFEEVEPFYPKVKKVKRKDFDYLGFTYKQGEGDGIDLSEEYKEVFEAVENLQNKNKEIKDKEKLLETINETEEKGK